MGVIERRSAQSDLIEFYNNQSFAVYSGNGSDSSQSRDLFTDLSADTSIAIANWTVTQVFREKKYNYYNDRPSMGSLLVHANYSLINREISFSMRLHAAEE